MQSPTVSPEAVRRTMRPLRLGLWALAVVGVWAAWAFDSYRHYDGLHPEHLVRNLAWGLVPAGLLALALAVATRLFDRPGRPGQGAWRKWARAALCVSLFAAAGLLLYALIGFIMLARAMDEWTRSGGPG